MDTTDTTPATLRLRHFAAQFKLLAARRADEDKYRAKQFSVGILNPARNQRFRKAVDIRKAHEAGLRAGVIVACERGELAEVERIETVYQVLNGDLALDPGDRKSERQRALGRRRDAAEQLLMAALEDELRHRRLI